MNEKVFFKDSHGHKLAAYYLPSNNMDAIVVMCHGLNSGKDSTTNKKLEKIFLENGISVFRFDFFAHGESEGKNDERTLNEFVDNVVSACLYVKNLGYKNIGIYAASFGGVAAAIAAPKIPELRVLAFKAAGMGHTSRFMPNYEDDFKKKIWIEEAKHIRVPSLIVHGIKDIDVEVELGENLADSIPKSRRILYESADHRFSKEEDFKRMIDDISKFIILHLMDI
jgi:pimeloyl-ACP methyl ester carboxylesterase